MKTISAYEVLGVSPFADLSEIQKAYRRRVREFHPDCTGEAEYENFLWIRKAYEILRNPEKRAHLGSADFFPARLANNHWNERSGDRINIYA